MTHCAMLGASGRMGRAIISLMKEGGLVLSGALDHSTSPFLGMDAGSVAGTDPLGVAITDSLERSLEGARVAIDFSGPAASLQAARECAARGVALVVGTTGFSPQEKAELLSFGAKIPLLVAPNMSVGVNLLFHLTSIAARALQQGYDVEVVEAHHRHKKDAPSGTAVRIKEVLLESLGRSEEQVIYGRQGITGERPPEQIGVHTVRGGDTVGEHTVLFMGEGERIELTHRASSRDTFARGAVRAALHLVEADPGVYSMNDVLQIGAPS